MGTLIHVGTCGRPEVDIECVLQLLLQLLFFSHGGGISLNLGLAILAILAGR